jgi:Ca2+/H+ antiporter, TMEM165/GDT1 family
VDFAVVVTTFALIFPVELPDKTFVATLVLSTRYPGRWVWVGVAAAFAVQCVIAVAAGGLLSLLPDRVVAVVVAILFTVGSIILFRSARTADDAEAEEERELAQRETRAATGLRAAGVCFGVLFAAEWGDLSQITTAGLAARYADPISVFAGAWIALVTVAAIGVLVGRTLLRYIHPSLVKRIAGTLFAVLALFTWLDVLGVDGLW